MAILEKKKLIRENLKIKYFESEVGSRNADYFNPLEEADIDENRFVNHTYKALYSL